jgi:hypothetical protein
MSTNEEATTLKENMWSLGFLYWEGVGRSSNMTGIRTTRTSKGKKVRAKFQAPVQFRILLCCIQFSLYSLWIL